MTKRRTRNSKNKILLKFGFFLYIVLSLFTIIWLKASVVNIKYELGELDQTKAELVRERKLVVAKRANFYSTERIEKVALNRLGMTLPMREKVFYVKRTPAAGPYRASMKQR